MFKEGDKLTYHGRHSHACDMVLSDGSDPSEWVFVRTTSKGHNYGDICGAWNPTHKAYPHSKRYMSFYEGDFELTNVGPEPYEEWFK